MCLKWKEDDSGRTENFGWDDAEPSLCDEPAGGSPGKKLLPKPYSFVLFF